MKDSVEYLGYHIDAIGLHAMDEKIKAITEAPIPKNLQELWSFLGLCRKFIPNLSLIFYIRMYLGNGLRICDQVFYAAKAKIISPNVLVHYDQ